MAKIRAKGSGPISLRGTDETDGIAEQFGGTKPDGVSEYYRGKDYGASAGGVVVEDNADNATITKSGAQAFSNYYGTHKASPLAPGPPGLGTPDEIDHAFGDKPDGSAETPDEILAKGKCFTFSKAGRASFQRDGKNWADGSVDYNREFGSANVSSNGDAAFQKFILDTIGIMGTTPYKRNPSDYIKITASLSFDVTDKVSGGPKGGTHVNFSYGAGYRANWLYNHRATITAAMVEDSMGHFIWKLNFVNPTVDPGSRAISNFSLYSHNGMKSKAHLRKPSGSGVEGVRNPPPHIIIRELARFFGVRSSSAVVYNLKSVCAIPYTTQTKGAVIAAYGGFDPWKADNSATHFPANPLKAAPYVPPLPPTKPPHNVIVLAFTHVGHPLTFGGGGGHASYTIHASYNGAPRVGLSVYIMGKWIGGPGGSWSGGAKLVAVGAGGTTDAGGNFTTVLAIPPKPAGAAEFWVGCTYLTTVGANVAGTPDSRRVLP